MHPDCDILRQDPLVLVRMLDARTIAGMCHVRAADDANWMPMAKYVYRCINNKQVEGLTSQGDERHGILRQIQEKGQEGRQEVRLRQEGRREEGVTFPSKPCRRPPPAFPFPLFCSPFGLAVLSLLRGPPLSRSRWRDSDSGTASSDDAPCHPVRRDPVPCGTSTRLPRECPASAGWEPEPMPASPGGGTP